MKHYFFIRSFMVGFLFFCLLLSCNSEEADPPTELPDKETHHPFLIVKKDQYQTLRDKSDTEPWLSMKEDAISRSGNNSGSSAYDLQYYVGAAALAYILDEENAQTHANRVKEVILNKYSKLEFEDGGSWGGVVPPMGSIFVAILALDIVYDALTIEEIIACEEVIADQIFKIDRDGSWIDVRLGTHGTWDIYKGDRTTPDDDYFESIMHQITVDGVSPVTNHYAWERVGGGNSRISKSGYMDVLEYTGIDNRYYSNEKLQKFHRWLFGSSVNCAREMAIFGDMLPTQGISNDMLHRRVVNFDMEAAGYAAWFHEGIPAYGNILTYMLPKQALPAPVVPSSKMYEDGGAFFREREDDPNGLHGVLYNIQAQDEWHTHQEVNGLALSGYGNRLMVNGGRLGAPTRAANLNNTLTINGEDHKMRVGGGIVEGFMTDEFDYSCGYSGSALGSADHYRNLLLVHGSGSTNPYFVVLDEVDASPGDLIKNYLHPANQSSLVTVTENTEYEASIDHYPSTTGAKLNFFYGTPPAEVNVELVPSAVPDRYPDYPDHNRLESVYQVNENGVLNLATILFPSNDTNSKPPITRIAEAGFSGGSIAHGSGILDIVLTTSSALEVVHGNIVFHGKSMVVREENAVNAWYFVRKGIKLDHASVGFEADAMVSIFVDGLNGVIISDGAKIKLKGQGMDQVTFQPAADVISSGDDFIEVGLPAGEVRFSGT